MSLNWDMLTPSHTLVLLPGEKTFLLQDKVSLVLSCNEDGYPGHYGGHWECRGNVTLTNQRIVFISTETGREASSTAGSVLQSLNVPVLQWKQWRLEQPWFGANYITGTLLPMPGGGLPKAGKLTLTFREGGAIEFTSIYRSLLERIGESNETPQHYEPLPAYEAGGSGPTPPNLPLGGYEPLPSSFSDRDQQQPWMPVSMPMPAPTSTMPPPLHSYPPPPPPPPPTDLPPSYKDLHPSPSLS
ncbi:hypothetical protein BDF14DRAFT_1845396 [Spinellus fusiger]|nr:hypothetical protein BDF14DRAFT_1845396 [Spinellus fusiger]